MISKTFTSVAAAALLSLGAVSTANATFTIDGITLNAGAKLTTVNLWEGERLGFTDSNGDTIQDNNNNGVIDQAGEELVGVGFVSTIQDANNNIIWQDGQNGKKLTIVLSNYFAAGTNSQDLGSGNSIDTISFIGGSVKIYSQAAGGFSANGTQASVLAAAAAGNLWLDLVGSPVGGLAAGQPVTLESLAINTSTAVDPFLSALNLSGQGLLDVTGGLAADNFNTNTFGCLAADGVPCPDTADLKFTSSGQLNALSPGQQEFGFRGTGDISAFVVPLPDTLALTGLALLGLGLSSRRSKANKA